jgi:hypothetical protein
MSTPNSYRVFVSAVTRELGSYRQEIARVLRRKELEVREQEHFRQGPATLLEQLRAYIELCDAVILLVGERCGASPTDEHAAALGTMPSFEDYRRSTGQARASSKAARRCSRGCAKALRRPQPDEPRPSRARRSMDSAELARRGSPSSTPGTTPRSTQRCFSWAAQSPADLRRNLAALCAPFVLNLPEQDATEAPSEDAG